MKTRVSDTRRAAAHRALDRALDRRAAARVEDGVTKSAWEDADQRQVEAWLRQIKAPKMLGPNRPMHAVPWDKLPKDVKASLRALDRREASDVNPDGTISADEPQRRKELVARFTRQLNQLVAEAKRDAQEIGGSFRSPGIQADLRKIADGIIRSL